ADKDALAAVAIEKIQQSDGQRGTVGKVLPIALGVQVRDAAGRPVEGTSVEYTVGAGLGQLLDADGKPHTDLVVKSDAQGLAAVAFRFGLHTADNPVNLQKKAGDPYPTQALVAEVQATALTRRGPLSLAVPFQLFGFPGVATALRRSDTTATEIVGRGGLWADTPQIRAEDAQGNPVSNVQVQFTVGAPTPDPTCTNTGTNPQNAVVFDPATCAQKVPVLGDCGSSTMTRTTSPLGTAVGVILGNSRTSAYKVNVTSGTLPPLVLRYAQLYQVLETGECVATLDVVFRTLFALGTAGQSIAAVPAGATLPQPLEFELLQWLPVVRPVWNGTKWTSVALSEGKWRRAQGTIQLAVSNRGVAGPPALTSSGTYLATVTTGVDPGLNTVQATGLGVGVLVPDVDPATGAPITKPLQLPFPVEDKLIDIWGLDARIVAVDPSPIQLTTDGKTQRDEVVAYTVKPPAYQSATTEMELVQDGTVVGTAIGTTRSGDGVATLQRGFPFDAEKTYQARLVLNRGSAAQVRSGAVALPISQGVFAEVSRAVSLGQDVDLLNQRYCPQAARFAFTLAQQARVALTVRPLQGENPDGSQALGDPRVLFNDQLLERGEHAYLLTPSGAAPADFELPAGTYQFALRGIAPNGSDETVVGTIVSEYRTRDSLPVGHTLVQGVDLWDGHLSLERDDLVVPGRGVPL
ncbi:MAG TPA: hypothetical protein VGE98_06685, partial [Thermoanaerobaculia bacterium]